jgi:CTD nuclear envelope phosphatase 1
MNSLNIITTRVSPTSSPAPSRTNSLGSLGLAVKSEEDLGDSGGFTENHGRGSHATSYQSRELDDGDHNLEYKSSATEETPLMADSKDVGLRATTWHTIPRRIASAFISSIRLVLSTLAAPGVWAIACLYDEDGNFSPLFQLKKLFGFYTRNPNKLEAGYDESSLLSEKNGSAASKRRPSFGYGGVAVSSALSSASSSSAMTSEDESEAERHQSSGKGRSSKRRHSRSKSLENSEEIAPARRSIRIKLHSDDALRQRKNKKSQSSTSTSKASGDPTSSDISAHLKSPTSPAGALTKYPKTPAPRRPLIPRRQPSYLNLEPPGRKYQKTLILDLDETLIHSMSKGGRMGSGHMVEVRLNTTYVGHGGQTSIGPQHPILYYVHKRPHCDDFLRRVSYFAPNGSSSGGRGLVLTESS